MTAKITEEIQKSLASRLKEDIINGVFKSGEWLKQPDIEERYSANRFEVRMALTDLAARNIVDHIANRGFRVIKQNLREREELFEVRTILEIAAARLCMQHVTPEDILALSELVDSYDNEIENGSKTTLRKLNVDFHERFYAISKNTFLCNQIKEMRELGLPGRSAGKAGAWDTSAGKKASNQDHADIVEYLKKGDLNGITFTIYRHLTRWREYTKNNETNE